MLAPPACPGRALGAVPQVRSFPPDRYMRDFVSQRSSDSHGWIHGVAARFWQALPKVLRRHTAPRRPIQSLVAAENDRRLCQLPRLAMQQPVRETTAAA
jgi:hypothetical protein